MKMTFYGLAHMDITYKMITTHHGSGLQVGKNGTNSNTGNNLRLDQSA